MVRKICKSGKLFKIGDIVSQKNPQGRPGKMRNMVIETTISRTGRCVMKIKKLSGSQKGKIFGVRFTEEYLKRK